METYRSRGHPGRRHRQGDRAGGNARCSRPPVVGSTSRSSGEEFHGTANTTSSTAAWMPENWYDVLLPHDAIFYGAVGWPAYGAGPCLAMGLADPVSPPLRPVREPPPVPAHAGHSDAARRPRARRHRLLSSCARTPKASIRRSAARLFEGTEREIVVRNRSSPPRCRPHPEVRVRARRQARGKAPDVGDEVERHRDHDAVLGRAFSRDGQRLSGHPHRPVPYRHPERAFRPLSRIASTSSSARNLFGDILSDLGPALRHDRHCAVGEHQSRAALSVAVRARARIGARYRREGIANPIGQIWSGALMLDHLGHADAAAAIVRAIEGVLADPRAPRTPDMGGKATTFELGRAIAATIYRQRGVAIAFTSPAPSRPGNPSASG